jgi:hypothetical protein
MGAGQHPKHGTLDHRKLRVGRESLQDGEKIRPRYLGSIVNLSKEAELENSDPPVTKTDDFRHPAQKA